jgi:hypothetical protein
MRRREFLGLALAARASGARAEGPRPRLATLSPSSQTARAARWGAFWEGMQAFGHSPDDFVVENRWADGDPDRLSGLAAELVRLDPQIIVCYGSEAPWLPRRRPRRSPSSWRFPPTRSVHGWLPVSRGPAATHWAFDAAA